MKTTDTPLRGRFLVQEKLANYISWRVGGKAERMYIPADKQDLQQFIASLSINEQVFYLGLGSNLLIREGGLRGTVINLRSTVKQMNRLDDTHIYVESGVPCAHVAKFCAKQNLAGAEFLAGIPGTMGGALKMNAGAFGSDTWSLVESVETMAVGGKPLKRQADSFAVSYRSVKGIQNGCFLSAILKLNAAKQQNIQGKIKQLLAQRATTQPTKQATCGSVFKNPPDDFSARLIEASGLKGYKMGGAQISIKHANFIINTGTASALDIEQLIEYTQAEVARQQCVNLHTEVCIIGDLA